jgi:hypothetical protein
MTVLLTDLEYLIKDKIHLISLINDKINHFTKYAMHTTINS